MSDESSENIQALVDATVKDCIEAEIARLKDRVRYFLYGFGGLVTLLVGLGLFTELEVVRFLHDEAFPPNRSDQVGISYQSVLHLKFDDSLQQTGRVTFYAEPTQEVELYLQFLHRFTGALGRRRVLVRIDQQELEEGALDQPTSSFQSIKKYLSSGSFSNPAKIHTATQKTQKYRLAAQSSRQFFLSYTYLSLGR
ncbi:MAG: hypothetical protein IH908_12150 [Proteobacteria bacterium]|nr:hypothetical protein [Pseudomonadota bacterium]